MFRTLLLTAVFFAFGAMIGGVAHVGGKAAGLSDWLIKPVWSQELSKVWDIDARNHTVDNTNFVVDNQCSGTLISVEHRLVLTNYHCVTKKVRTVERDEVQPDGSVKKVRREDHLSVPIAQHRYLGFDRVGTTEFLTDIVAAEQRWDLALLQFKAQDIPFAVQSTFLPEHLTVRRSEPVWAVGNPTMLDASMARGVISSVTRTFTFPWTGNRETPMLQFDAAIAGGSSGGALYNDQGYLIGVPSAGQANQFMAIPLDTVRAFLRRNGWGVVLGDEPVEKED